MAGSTSGRLSARKLQAVRQHVRQVCPVRQVRKTVALGPQPREVGPSSLLGRLTVFTLAAAVLCQYRDSPSRTLRFDGGETDYPAGSRGDAFTTGSGGNGIHFDDIHGFNQGATFIRENEIGTDNYGTAADLWTEVKGVLEETGQAGAGVHRIADEEESDPLETDYDWELEEG